MEIRQTFDVGGPPEAVFAVLTDPERLHEWQPTTVDVRRKVTGPLSEGEVFEETHKAGPRRLDSTFRCVAYDPPRAFALEAVDGPVKFDGRWELAGSGAATTVSFTGTGDAPRLLAPLMRRALDRRFRGYHAKLSALVEAGRAAAPPPRSPAA
jgi:carbon monoxide dehydrogenase subunit G